MIHIYFFPNGVTVAFNDDNEQLPSLAEPWFKLYLKFLKEQGEKPEDIDFTMPDQQKAVYLPEYDNWKIV